MAYAEPGVASCEPVDEVLTNVVDGRGRVRSMDSDNDERFGGRDFGASEKVAPFWKTCSRS